MAFNPEDTIEIDAPLATVWRVLSDFDAYPQWNPLLSFDGEPIEGRRIGMRVALAGKKLRVPVTLTRVRADEELAWQGGPKLLMAGDHYFRISAIDADRTRLVQGEAFSGLGVPVIYRALRGALDKLYADSNVAIKARAELLQREG